MSHLRWLFYHDQSPNMGNSYDSCCEFRKFLNFPLNSGENDKLPSVKVYCFTGNQQKTLREVKKIPLVLLGLTLYTLHIYMLISNAFFVKN